MDAIKYFKNYCVNLATLSSISSNNYFIDSYFVTHSLLAIWQLINHNCNFHHL